jgi:mannose-6-phosphate isomerase
MNELYPLKFTPILKERIWGGEKLNTQLHKKHTPGKCGESWEISCIGEDISVVSNGFLAENQLDELIEIYMGDLVGDTVYDKFGNTFPLLIKFLDASDILSIQVHPNDELAEERHKCAGKTEMWYIIDNEPNAELICGFNKQIDRKEVEAHIENKTLPNILNVEKVQAGEVYYVPAGRVHAIGAGILLAEIQQTSDITYRLYDWDRKNPDGTQRELHTAMALDAIDYNVYTNYKLQYQIPENKTSNILDCPYFFSNILHFNKQVEKDYILIDSFVIYMCVEGKFQILFNEGESISVSKGETVLIPAALKNLSLVPEVPSKIIETYIK